MRLGFLGLLGVCFIGLKLGGVIDWSWWWVLSPLLFVGVMTLLILGGMVVGGILEDRQ